MSVSVTFYSGADTLYSGFVRVGHNSSSLNPDAVWKVIPTQSDAYRITSLSFVATWNNNDSGTGGWNDTYTYKAVLSTSAADGATGTTVTASLGSSSGTGTWDIDFTDLSIESGKTLYLHLNFDGTTKKTLKSFSKVVSGSISEYTAYAVPTVSAPANQTEDSGSAATFSVSASDGMPASYSYQWQLSTNGGSSYSNISDAKASSFTTSATTAAMNGYRYRCVVSNEAGSVTSSAATLTVQYEMTLNSSYPQNITVNNASTASFSVSISTAGNPAAYTYQWQKNGSNISDATSSSYTTPTLYYVSDNGNKYKCVVTHTATGRTETSREATLTVSGYPPSINTQPASQTIDEGGDVTFTVGVTAGNPSETSYQWQISTNGGSTYNNISGETTTTLTITGVTYAAYHNARLRLYTSNTIGGVYSNAAVLTVNRYPNTPTIIVPKAGSKTYNTRPYIVYQWGTDPDGNGVLGNVKIGATTLDSNNAAWDNKGTKTNAATSLIKFTQLDAGSKTLEAFGNDGRVNSSTVSVNFIIEVPTFTDTITANVTPVKATHFIELKTMFNEIEAYYGLTETVWSELEAGGRVRAVHVIELRQAAERIRTYINSVATTAFQIPAFAWTDTTLINKRIKAVHLNEIRSKISLL